MKHAEDGTTAPAGVARLLTAALSAVGLRGGGHVERRRHPRSPAELAGTLDDVVVWVADLTTVGAGLVGPHPVGLGVGVVLTVELPMMDGHIHSTHLRLTVTACRPDLGSSEGWRIGGTVVPVSDLDRIALVEYCHQGAASFRLGRGGVPKTSTVPPGVPEPVLAARG